MSTVFSMIIAGDIPGRFVWADERCVVFASINPISPGHMLVVPRTEIAKFTDAGDELLAYLILVAKRIGQACERAFDAPRAAMLVAGFEVPHLHLHVLPAWGEAELSFSNAQTDVPSSELDAAAIKIRAALVELGYEDNVPPNLGSAEL